MVFSINQLWLFLALLCSRRWALPRVPARPIQEGIGFPSCSLTNRRSRKAPAKHLPLRCDCFSVPGHPASASAKNAKTQF